VCEDVGDVEEAIQVFANHNGLPSQSDASPRITSDPPTRHANSRTAAFSGFHITSLASQYDMSNLVKIKHRRQGWVRLLVEYGTYTVFACFTYFVLIGVPLWSGAVFWLYVLVKNKFVFQGGWLIFIIMVILSEPRLLAQERAIGIRREHQTDSPLL
jgi:hypothetical protein